MPTPNLIVESCIYHFQHVFYLREASSYAAQLCEWRITCCATRYPLISQQRSQFLSIIDDQFQFWDPHRINNNPLVRTGVQTQQQACIVSSSVPPMGHYAAIENKLKMLMIHVAKRRNVDVWVHLRVVRVGIEVSSAEYEDQER